MTCKMVLSKFTTRLHPLLGIALSLRHFPGKIAKSPACISRLCMFVVVSIIKVVVAPLHNYLHNYIFFSGEEISPKTVLIRAIELQNVVSTLFNRKYVDRMKHDWYIIYAL